MDEGRTTYVLTHTTKRYESRSDLLSMASIEGPCTVYHSPDRGEEFV